MYMCSRVAIWFLGGCEKGFCVFIWCPVGGGGGPYIKTIGKFIGCRAWDLGV